MANAKPKKRKFNLRNREDVSVRAKDGFQLLVNEVKKHPVLYNPFHDGYTDPKRKRNAWLHISRELLQSTRNNSLTKIRSSWTTGVAILQRKLKEKPKKPWKYMEDMEFIMPFIDAKVKRKEMLRMFNETKIARLIQEVKKYPHLYNPSHFSYNAHKVKRMTWIKIGEKLGCTSERAKYLWKKSLQHFREGINQKEEGNIEPSKQPIEEWQHYKSMEFMKKFVSKRSELIYKEKQDERKNKIVRLIKAVEEHPVLYNPHWTNSNIVKRNAWSIIGQKLKHPCHKAAEKWVKLKYEFILNAKRQKMIKQGTLNYPSEPWKYMIEMKFLLPFVGGMTEGDLIDKEKPLEGGDIVRLITEIKNYPALYDPAHSEYNNFPLRDYNWTLIANKFSKCSVAKVKESWRRIQNNYLRVIKRNMSNERGLRILKYKYQKELEFLLPILKARNFTVDDVNNERCPYFEDDDTVPSSICDTMEQNAEVHGVPQAESEKSQQPDNSMYHFFMSIYNSTNELPAVLQLEMKKKIFKAVTSAEEIWLASTSASPAKQS